jgi:hypothetical protein
MLDWLYNRKCHSYVSSHCDIFDPVLSIYVAWLLDLTIVLGTIYPGTLRGNECKFGTLDDACLSVISRVIFQSFIEQVPIIDRSWARVTV